MEDLGKEIPVFSWDPRTKVWVCERGPEAAKPPVPPLDQGAVQTYFLDLQSGRWSPSILGIKARQISMELKDAYRSPYQMGLMLPRAAEPAAKTLPAQKRSPGVMLGGLVAALIVIGAGGYAASAVRNRANATPSPTSAPTGTVAAADPSASAAPSTDATAAPTAAPGGCGGGGGGGGNPTPRPPTPAPTPQLVRLTVKLPDGTQVFLSSFPSVAQGTNYNAVLTALVPDGRGTNQPMTVYLGEPNGTHVSALMRPDVNGNYVLNVIANVPKGEQKVSVVYGITAGVFTLGTITVR